MTDPMNPYRPSNSNDEVGSRKSHFLSIAMFDGVLATLLYAIGAIYAFAIRTSEWNSDMVVISLIPPFLAVPAYVILRSFSRLKKFGLLAYFGIGLLFILTAGLMELVYPVFLGMRRDVMVPMIIGVVLSGLCLVGLNFVRRRC